MHEFKKSRWCSTFVRLVFSVNSVLQIEAWSCVPLCVVGVACVFWNLLLGGGVGSRSGSSVVEV